MRSSLIGPSVIRNMTHSEEEAAAIGFLNTIQNSCQSAPEEALRCLKRVKHSLIGHDESKQLYVDNNIIQLLVRILGLEPVPKELKLEAGVCIGSLAYGRSIRKNLGCTRADKFLGGEFFASRLLQGGVLGPLIAALDLTISPPKLVLCSLRTLNTLFDTCPSEISTTHNSIAGIITSEIYSNRNALKYIQKILSQTSPSPLTQQQIALAATLVSKSCRHGGSGEKAATNMEKHQIMLVNVGILEALGRRLAGFILRSRDSGDGSGSKLATRGANGHDEEDKENSHPFPAPITAQLAPLLDAISVIIKNNPVVDKDDSHGQHEFLSAPWVLSAFPASSPAKHTLSKPRSKNATVSPTILPASDYPPLSAVSYFTSGTSRAVYAQSSVSDTMGDTESALSTPAAGSDTEDSPRKSGKRFTGHDISLEDSPVIKWLIQVVRQGDALTRLMAASLLINLCHRETGAIVKNIERMVLPILVRLLDDDPQSLSQADYHKGGAAVGGYQLPQGIEWIIRERAPAVLADLINDSEKMQKAAVDAHAIKRLAGMLKKTFEVTSSSAPSKETNGVLRTKSQGSKSASDSRIDDHTRVEIEPNSPYKVHRMKVRESTLRCISGLASLKDDYRKMVIDAGVVPYIVASLHPVNEVKAPDLGPSNTTTTEASATPAADEISPPGPSIVKEGNPPRVLIAAAYAIKSLSRSVNLLRTSLIDSGVAAPVTALLHNEDVEVKIAATMALCNLVLEFSPMRQSIIDSGVLKILCEQAHSCNAELKLNSLWALKHYIYQAGPEVKTSALKGLGSGWLVDLISWDSDLVSNSEGEEEEEEAGERDEEEDDEEDCGEEEGESSRGRGGDEFDEDESMVDDGAGSVAYGPLFSGHPSQRYLQEPSEDNNNQTRVSTAQLTSQRETASDRRQSTQSIVDTSSSIVEHEISARALRRTRKQLLEVQEHALDFLRNLISGQDAPEMLDLLFTSVGESRVYDILTRKLQQRPIISRSGRNSRRPTTVPAMESTPHHTSTRSPPAEILIPIIYILAHIATNHSQHRENLIKQTELLKNLLPFFDHAHKEVRVSLAWLVINLTWKDDGADEVNSKSRAAELKRLGFMSRLEGLLQDKVLDVKERAKTGLYQIKQCLGEA